MTNQQQALDQAFFDAALEEVCRETPQPKTLPARTSQWPAMKAAAALLLGISAVIAVQMMSGGDSNNVTPAQNPAPSHGPLIKPRDADHARELLQQVQAISMAVAHVFKTDTRISAEPWEDCNHVLLTIESDDIAAIGAQFAEGIEKSVPAGRAIHERNQISLHLPAGRLVCTYNKHLDPGLRMLGLGAWQPSKELAAWITERQHPAEEQARRQSGIVTPADIEANAAWLADLTTVRASGLGDQHMSALLGIKGLHTLDLSKAKMSNDSLTELHRLKNLRVLILDDWRSYRMDGANPWPRTMRWAAALRSLRACPTLEVISLRRTDITATALIGDMMAASLATTWQGLQLLDLHGSKVDAAAFASLRMFLPRTMVSHPEIHAAGELRHQHPSYYPNSRHAERLLRAAVEFAKLRGFAVVSVAAQHTDRSGLRAPNGLQGTSCDVGPEIRILQQGLDDHQWRMKTGEAIHLYPATHRDRVILLPTKTANWIAHDDRTEQMVVQFLAGRRYR